MRIIDRRVTHLTPDELQVILDKLDSVCAQAQELQKQIRQAMAEAARRDYPVAPVERRKATRKHRR